MAKLVVDGQEIDVPADYTLLQACEEVGAEVPRFCFHERLSVAGNCRMCLVEVAGAPKPVASCAMAVKDLRPGPEGQPPAINTRTPSVKKAREGVMEFLLINHPLDCPICDQGGECDLQDQAMAYGIQSSRYTENKRAVENKHIGPLVKTIMTRCIHCTRCVRFVSEVTGIAELGAISRGEDMEITTYLEQAMTSELQGNVIDLCPVGALTSKPYAYQARPWELTKTESIDVMDAMGAAIRLDTRGREVMRIMPRLNEAVNEEWISDKSRFVWDGLKTQRLDQPYARKNGKLTPVSWAEALSLTAEQLKAAAPEKIGAIAGDLASVEEMYALKQLMSSLGVTSLDCRQDGTKLDPAKGRASYLFNATIEGIEDADAIIIIGANPRLEAPVLNARIRKTWLNTNVPVGLIGEQADLTYDYRYIGAGNDSLAALLDGKDAFADILKNAERPLIIVGQAALSGADGAEVLAAAARLAEQSGAIAEEWNGLSVLHTAAARVGGLDLGFVPGEGGKAVAEMQTAAEEGRMDAVILLGADELDMASFASCFTIYIGSHGDRGAHAADIILPGSTYAEKSGTYVNMEGRVQMTNRAAFAPGLAKEDWAILRALSGLTGEPLPFDNLAQLRAALYQDLPHMAALDQIADNDTNDVLALGKGDIALGARAYAPYVTDFYLTNPIARASAVMADCSAVFNGQKTGATGTNG